MNKDIELIEEVIDKVNEYKKNFNFPDEAYSGLIKLLSAIKTKLLLGEDIPERWLRGCNDLATSIAIQDEDTEFHAPFFNFYYGLQKKYPRMKKLDLLGIDFGRENPV